MDSRIYDKIFDALPEYNQRYWYKDLYIDRFVETISGKILDAGCGQGFMLKHLISSGKDAFGIDFSKTCCDKYLTGLPHKHDSIMSHAEYMRDKKRKYDAVLCLDVLEHISHGEIDANLAALRTLSTLFLIGIANHSDVILGVELHLIQENDSWWFKKLSQFFSVQGPVTIFKSVHHQELTSEFYFFSCATP